MALRSLSPLSHNTFDKVRIIAKKRHDDINPQYALCTSFAASSILRKIPYPSSG